MAGSTKFSLDKVAGEPWGAAFAREFELVVAANVFASMQSGQTLYDTQLQGRLAAFCAPLDGALDGEFLGVVDVPTDGRPVSDRIREAVAPLAQRSRGVWAVFNLNGKYDAYMADGLGGIATASGEKFVYGKATAPAFTFENLYGEVLSMTAFRSRGPMTNEIFKASVAAANIQPGQVATNVELDGRRWSKLKFIEFREGHYVGGEGVAVLEGTRRGVKPQQITMSAKSFTHHFGIPLVLPAAYADSGNAARLATLGELRARAAQVAWDDYAERERPDVASFNTRGGWLADGDALRRTAYCDDRGAPLGHTSLPPVYGEFTVVFAPDTDEVVSATMATDVAPGPRR